MTTNEYTTDTRTPAEIAYDAVRLSPAPAAAAVTLEAQPAITAETWQSEAGEPYTDFTIGDGLTRVLIGTYNDKPGIELVIGGACINTYLHEVITLADVRQLRDNLTALLEDTQLQAAERRANLATAARMVDACTANIRRAG